ncbi:acyltransferase [Amycolatopsis sp. NPDC051128]|uniref:acyltransferase n=1 Tax=Amycolatopsis sp. NPDC051128 TaxID=3155412 RepID=UPI00341EF1BC
MRRLLRGVRRAGALGASSVRVGYARFAFPGVTITGSVLGPGCEVYAGQGARIVLRGVVVGRGCVIIAGPGAHLSIEAGSIGPHSVIVARERIEIGEGALLAEMTVVRDADHDTTAGLQTGLHVTSPVHIGSGVWLGAHATVLRGVTIGSGATVGAGAVVTRDVAPGSTVTGVPATDVHRARTSGGGS